ncbi:CheR family methyltransferase [Salinibius halmophilus]|uniref:CheR family methyltransferase n=1 Tax=Salinibius halmophilus TaxID=1853216 RepID=UPI000E672F32|nr:protein-glutamate O-methyltransferase CheR [Salinibius halmophilus]
MTEFAYTDADFATISKKAYEIAGIVLGDNKRSLVYSRIARRLRALNIATFAEYSEFLDRNPEEEEPFVNAITTNLTKFFREAHHFEFLAERVSGWHGKHSVWSAGCSTGEEPWSIALTLAKAQKLAQTLVLATDIDTNVLAKASLGEYAVDDTDLQTLHAYRQYLQMNRNRTTFRVSQTVHENMRFRRLNLQSEWPMKKPFDVIFCRNVMIYFDDQTRQKLALKFIQQLKPGGYLIIGHSESLHRFKLPLKSVGPTIYQVAS